MTNQTTSAVVTPPQIIRATALVPNGKETDSSIHYDEFHPVTDADIVHFVNYLKNPTVAAILGTDNVQQAIEKLDKKDDYIEGKADAAQSTANTALSRANNALSVAEEALDMIYIHQTVDQFYITFKDEFAIQAGYGNYGALDSWETISFHINFQDGLCVVMAIPMYTDAANALAVKDVTRSSFKIKGADLLHWVALGYI